MLYLCVFLVVFIAHGCSYKQAQNPSQESSQQEQPIDSTSANEDWTDYVQSPVIDPTFNSTDEKVYTIDTKYAKLTYPEKWKDKVRYEINEHGTYTVLFYGNVGSRELPLFDLIFGESGDYKLGTLTVDSETIPLYVHHYEMENVGLTNEEYENWIAMCEDINVIISELENDYGLQIA